MPVRFWDDPDGERYRASYFADFPGIWRHGDWATLTDDGAIVVLGRSDSTLNRHGVRIGTAEIYAGGRSPARGGRQPGHRRRASPTGAAGWRCSSRSTATRSSTTRRAPRIVEAIRAAASPRHVPDEIVQVPAIPRTMTGKKLEVPIKRLFMGADAATAVNRNAVADPAALDAFVELAAARSATLRR